MTLNELEPAERRRLARSAGGGAIAWVIALIVLAFVPVSREPFPEPDYPPVHLTLTSPPAATAPAKKPAESAAPTPKPAEPSAPSATASTAAPATKPATPKPSTANAPAPSKVPATPAAPASSGLGIPDFDKPITSSNTSTGEAEFLDFTNSRQTANPSVASAPSGGTARSELEGSAATVTSGTSAGASVSSRSAANSSGGTASASTSAALQGVEGAASTGVSGSSGTATAGSSAGRAETTSTAGRVSSVAGLSFEGVPRELLYPEDPRISLPERLAKLIDSDRAVTVQFTVRKDGSVPGTLVTFTPLAALPAEIRDYLRTEFAKWRFEPGNQDGQARFSYSIKME